MDTFQENCSEYLASNWKAWYKICFSIEPLTTARRFGTASVQFERRQKQRFLVNLKSPLFNYEENDHLHEFLSESTSLCVARWARALQFRMQCGHRIWTGTWSSTVTFPGAWSPPARAVNPVITGRDCVEPVSICPARPLYSVNPKGPGAYFSRSHLDSLGERAHALA